MEKLLTIYTPTYNRIALLKRVYKSLLNQSSKNFIWMIIDDGSDDNTKEIVEEWLKNEKGFKIEYFYKDNEGVHTARDFAYSHCNTELIVSIDSDDWLVNNAVETIEKFWKEKGKEEYAGIFGKCIFENGNEIGTKFPNIKALTFQTLTYKYHFKGDKMTIVRTDIIKEIPKSPQYKGEKLVSETYKWIQLPEDKPFLLLNTPTKVVEYQKDGYSANAYESVFKNTNGFRANYRQYMISSKYLWPKLKGYIGYIACSLLLKDNKFIKNSPYPVKTILLLPLGIIGLISFKVRRKRINKLKSKIDNYKEK